MGGTERKDTGERRLCRGVRLVMNSSGASWGRDVSSRRTSETAGGPVCLARDRRECRLASRSEPRERKILRVSLGSGRGSSMPGRPRGRARALRSQFPPLSQGRRYPAGSSQRVRIRVHLPPQSRPSDEAASCALLQGQIRHNPARATFRSRGSRGTRTARNHPDDHGKRFTDPGCAEDPARHLYLGAVQSQGGTPRCLFLQRAGDHSSRLGG